MGRLTLLPLFFIIIFITSCNQHNDPNQQLQAKVDSLQTKLNNAYKPGTGEIMSNIVLPHHLRLWFAGQNKNWPLAAYEAHMISGGFKRIEKFHKGTPEANAAPMIYPSLAAMEKAIRQKDVKAFNTGFVLMTNMCNTCHSATKYEFNVIAVPTIQHPTNQRFDVIQKDGIN